MFILHLRSKICQSPAARREMESSEISHLLPGKRPPNQSYLFSYQTQQGKEIVAITLFLNFRNNDANYPYCFWKSRIWFFFRVFALIELITQFEQFGNRISFQSTSLYWVLFVTSIANQAISALALQFTFKSYAPKLSFVVFAHPSFLFSKDLLSTNISMGDKEVTKQMNSGSWDDWLTYGRYCLYPSNVQLKSVKSDKF